LSGRRKLLDLRTEVFRSVDVATAIRCEPRGGIQPAGEHAKVVSGYGVLVNGAVPLVRNKQALLGTYRCGGPFREQLSECDSDGGDSSEESEHPLITPHSTLPSAPRRQLDRPRPVWYVAGPSAARVGPARP